MPRDKTLAYLRDIMLAGRAQVDEDSDTAKAISAMLDRLDEIYNLE